MNQFFKLLASMFKRVTTAITMPFRMLLVRVQKLFNVNIISAKLIKPLTANVKKLFTLKPRDKSDYFSFFGLWVYKKLVGFLLLAACAFVFIYFGTMAKPVDPPPTQLTGMKTDVTFDYDDMALKDFSGVANIRDYDGNIVYTGEISAGACNGVGTLYTRGGTLLYEGQFANNAYSGEGVRYHPNGRVEYEGGFADNHKEGQGRQYDTDGTLMYEGGFRGGRYDGEGKQWNAAGTLVYEGAFANGLAQGQGRRYYDTGKLRYEGEFYAGQMQGAGMLYTEAGQLVYTGKMHAGRIDYLSLLGGTLADASAAFDETPTIFYQEAGVACYLYQRAGIVLTTDCRVKVLEWQREKTGDNAGNWYLPGTYAAIAPARLLAAPPAAQARLSGASASSSSSSSQAASSSQPAAEPWPNFTELPEFVDSYKLLYFEVDKDVWEYEAEKYEPKVFIKKVTLLDVPNLPTEGTTPLDDDPPPTLEECVAIDALRLTIPTAFPDVHFEMDKQNKLFQRVWNINYADRIARDSFTLGDVTYRICYTSDTKDTPVFISVER